MEVNGITDKNYNKTVSLIGKVVSMPLVRVNRKEFLSRESSEVSDERLYKIIHEGPQSVYTPDELEMRANKLIKKNILETAGTSFLAGLPSNPVTASASAGADIIQYFGFAIHLAQQLCYLFGKDELFSENNKLTENGQEALIIYLGIMLGVSSANSGLMFVSRRFGGTAEKKIAKTAVTQTAWYPILKKVGNAIGIKITKQSTGKFLTKAIPVLGGIVSGGLTFISFKPMGMKLEKTLKKGLESDPIIVEGEIM